MNREAKPALRKPCVIVSDDPLTMQLDWPVLPDLDHAIRLVKGIWTDYAQ